jgi:hypothetical protein
MPFNIARIVERMPLVVMDAEELPFVYVCTKTRPFAKSDGTRVLFFCNWTLAQWIVGQDDRAARPEEIRAAARRATMNDVRKMPQSKIGG